MPFVRDIRIFVPAAYCTKQIEAHILNLNIGFLIILLVPDAMRIHPSGGCNRTWEISVFRLFTASFTSPYPIEPYST